MSNQGFKCNVDLVIAIDATGSMTPIIENVKNKAKDFHQLIDIALTEKNRYVDNLRIKVIVFRDYFVDGDQSMIESKFFKMPDEIETFTKFVNTISANGGGDEPESALEALALSIDSDWVTDGAKKRHIVVMWTDASAHPIEKGASSSSKFYPKDLPKTFNQLSDLWLDDQKSKIGKTSKRLILFTPDTEPWSTIATDWELTTHIPSKAGEGLDEIEMDLVLNTIAGSI